MKCKWLLLMIAATFTASAQTDSQNSLGTFQKRAAKFNSVITLPEFETSTNEIRNAVKKTVATGNAALDKIGRSKPPTVTFESTVQALDDAAYQISLTANRLSLIKETSTDSPSREAATDALKELEEWMVGLDYREDVYRSVKAYADTNPKLKGEDAKLLTETMRDYRRAGLDLPKARRDEVEKMRKELASLTTDFESNVTKA